MNNWIKLILYFSGANYKVVCYLESWAIYRPEPATSRPSDVDPNGCTHVIYSFLALDKKSYTVTISDPDYDVIRGNHFNLNLNSIILKA